MIASLILLFLYALFCVWVAYHVWKNYDLISMFSFKRWILGSSHSANWFKGAAFVIVLAAGMSIVGYLESIT